MQPSSVHNKHVVSLAKTQALGHLARSTSSEVDNEVAHALASGRSIVSKTDWKEDDAQFLVQLIENQFPKGNIIWDWVGQQMVNRGFTKSQCRSKWKRIRTKVLHGDGTQTTKDRDYAREPDELLDDDDDEPSTAAEDAARWHSRQESGRSHGSQRTQSSRYRSRSPTSRSYQPSGQPRYDDRRSERDMEEENEIWSDDEDPNNGYSGYEQDHYPNYGESPSSARPRQHSQSHYRQSSSNMADENGEDSRLSAIATPNSFGKIEWKPEDSEFLVRLIESKFASRKVDWAWVSKQMEGRGYDRTQCKSRWWRVQHRQNQSGHGGSHGLNASRRQRQESGVTQGQDDKHVFVDSDNEDALQGEQQGELTTVEAQQGRDDPSVGSRASSVSEGPNSSRSRHDQQDTSNSKGEQQPPAEGRSSKGEHQKHIEWKEEDSRYMYRIIEREFPVGNVVWSVIAERMASRGYSQTQCMSKWRRHLKHSKLSNEGNVKGSGMSMDLDADMGSVTSGTGAGLLMEDERSPQHYRQSHRAESGGAKRLKTGPRDSGVSRDSEDYGHVGPLEARLVEMEYDRYYDAGGKRRRIEEAESHPDHSSHHRRHSHHHRHHHNSHQYDRSASIPYEDRYPKEHNDGYKHRDQDPASASYYADYYRDEREPPFDPRYSRHDARYEDETRLPREEEASRPALVNERYEPTATVVSVQGMGEERDEELPLESRGEPHSSSRRYHNQPIAAGEPQPSWTEERREGGGDANPDNREIAVATSPRLSYRGTPSHQAPPPPAALPAHHRQRSSSVASSGYREAYGSTSGQYYGHTSAGHDAPSVRSSRPDHHLQRQEGSHRPPEPVQRSRPIARSPERGFVGTYQGRRATATRQTVDRDEMYASRYESDGHRRVAPPLPTSSSYRYHHDELDYDRRRRYEGSLARGGPQDGDHEPLIDYAMEDDLDWAAGRWESRDMARLAAAVARQGRRWDAIRERIRVPVLVSPYDDDDEVYDGVRFEPFPYYRSEPRRISQSSLSGAHYQQSRPRSGSHGHHQHHHGHSRRQYTQSLPHQHSHRSSTSRHEGGTGGPLYAPPRQSRTTTSSGLTKRAMPPRAIPEVVDVDLTTDVLSGDEGVIKRGDMDREPELISSDDPEQQQQKQQQQQQPSQSQDQPESELAPTTTTTTEEQEESTSMSVDADEPSEIETAVVEAAAGDQEPKLVNDVPEPMEEEEAGEPTTAAAAGIATEEEGVESMPSVAAE